MIPSKQRSANMANLEALHEKGWYLSASRIEELPEHDKRNNEALIRAALDLDLREIAARNVSDGVNKYKSGTVDGPCVLQIQKIRNISAPKDNEESQTAPPLLKLTLTDGSVTCTGLEIEKISTLNLNTPPGTKLQLKGKVSIKSGFIHLKGSNCEILGGRVDKLVENWELKRNLAKHTRSDINSTDGGPPAFVPFGQKRGMDHPPSFNRRDNFKSLDANKDKEKLKEDSKFDQQREATIAQALQAKEGRSKTFAVGTGKQIQSSTTNDKDIAKIVEMGFTAEQATLALRQNSNNVQEAINMLISEPTTQEHSVGSGAGGKNMRGHARGPDRDSRDIRERDQKDSKDPRERGRGRKNRGDEEGDDYSGQSRPSGPATIFDFLTDKIPASSKSTEPKERKEEKISSHKPHQEVPQQEREEVDQNQQKRGLHNLPPRLARQQMKREEERAQRQRPEKPSVSVNSGSDTPPLQQQQQLQQTQQSISHQTGQRGNQGNHKSGAGRNNEPYWNNSQYDSQGNNQNSGRSWHGGTNRQDRTGRNGGYQRTYDVNSRGPVSNRGLWTGDRSGEDGNKRRSDQNRNGDGNYRDRYQDRGTARKDKDQDGGNWDSEWDGQNNSQYNKNQSRNRDNYNSRGDYYNQHRGNTYGDQSQTHVYASGRPNQHNDHQGNMTSHGHIDNSQSQTKTKSSVSHSKQPIYSHIVPNRPPSSVNIVGQDQTNGVAGDSSTTVSHTGMIKTGPMQQPTYVTVTPQQLVQQVQNLNITGPPPAVSLTTDTTQQPHSVKQLGMTAVHSSDQRLDQMTQNIYTMQQQPASQVPCSAEMSQPLDYNNAAFTKVTVPSYTRQNDMVASTKGSRQWKPGDYCLARYWEDKQFYRANVQCILGDGQCGVVFTDYGNTEYVPVSEIRAVPKEVWEMSIPTQASTASTTQQLQSSPQASNSAMSVPGIMVQGPPTVQFLSFSGAPGANATVDPTYQQAVMAYPVSTTHQSTQGQHADPQYARRTHQPQQQYYMPPAQRTHHM